MKNIAKYILMLIVLGLAIPSYSENYISSKLLPSVRDADAYEIGDIQFKGNISFTDDFLMTVISSKATARSFPHKVLQSYYFESKKNRAAPRILVREFNTAIKSLEHELRFFDVTSVESDTLSLWHFYNTNGFHDVKVSFSFTPNYKRRMNVLTFIINEGNRYAIDTVAYPGLEEVAPEVKRNINKIISRRKGTTAQKTLTGDEEEGDDETHKKRFYFNEGLLIREINAIHEELLNNGYYYAWFEKPKVSMDTINYLDSISTLFNIGKRVKFGNVVYFDSTFGQHVITREMKARQLEFQPGQWYSRRKLNNSIDNLLAIGAFTSVNIDTTYSQINSDGNTIMNFSIESFYRKQKEWGVGLFTNHTQLTNYNAGIEGSISHRNLFGMGQNGNFYSSIALKDIGRFFADFDNFDFEMQVGARFSQPLLWTIDNSRVGVLASLGYSVRTINNFFQINTLSLPIKFPVKLPKQTYFNTMSIDFIFEREDPVNFVSAVSNSLKNAENNMDSLRVIEAFYLYNNLHQYLKEPGLHIWTSNTIGFSLVGDNKNHPFNPTNGTYTFISLDGWNVFLSHPSISGIARFFRFQFLHSQYFTVTNNLVAAYKARFGSIYLMDEANVYVPIEKQFFAGGGNSVRGWSSRTLRYSKINADSLGSAASYKYMQNFIGNGGLLEGSFELRYKVNKPRGFSDFIAGHIGNLILTSFIDFGNAFHWYIGIDDYKLKFTDYFTKLAVSAGAGILYDTPFGPIRFDVATPLHDPLGRRKAFSRVEFHIGIGHAF